MGPAIQRFLYNYSPRIIRPLVLGRKLKKEPVKLTRPKWCEMRN